MVSVSFDISLLPSLKEGMSIQEETMKRYKTCRFIEEAGRVLKLPRVARSTAMVFFHRFYAKHSFNEHDRFEVAVACIVLAAKTEESPRKLNIVIDECHKLKVRGMHAGRISHTAHVPPAKLDPKEPDFIKLKERVLLLERLILHTIGFELSIDHPYKFAVEQIGRLVSRRFIEFADSSKTTGMNSTESTKVLMDTMVQGAMNFVNDSMQTTLCIQFTPEKIATTTVFLSAQFSNVQPKDGKDWMALLGDPDVDDLVSISSQIIELILDRKGVDVAAYRKIREEVERLKTSAEPDAKRLKTG